MGKGDLAKNLANFELANLILVVEPNFSLANTNEYFAKYKIFIIKNYQIIVKIKVVVRAR